MKTICIIFLSLLISAIGFSQTEAQKTNIQTISKGENVLISESSSAIICSNGEVCVTVYSPTQKSFYVYKNGTKTGPFTKNEVANFMCKSEYLNQNSVYVYDYDFDFNSAMSFDEQGKTLFKFNGKTYGPYQSLISFYFSENGKQFAAISVDENMKPTIVSSVCPDIAIEGNLNMLQFSPSGNSFIALTNVLSDLEAAMAEKLSKLGSNMTDEEMMKVMQEITTAQENASPEESEQKAYVYTSAGAKFGPYDANNLYGSNPAYCISGGDNWMMTIEGKIYINGVLIKDISPDYVSTGELWISKDAKQYAIKKYDKIIFSNGKEYPYPIFATYCNEMLVWFCLENETNLVKYTVKF
jgi:hypothetical protein